MRNLRGGTSAAGSGASSAPVQALGPFADKTGPDIVRAGSSEFHLSPSMSSTSMSQVFLCDGDIGMIPQLRPTALEAGRMSETCIWIWKKLYRDCASYVCACTPRFLTATAQCLQLDMGCLGGIKKVPKTIPLLTFMIPTFGICMLPHLPGAPMLRGGRERVGCVSLELVGNSAMMMRTAEQFDEAIAQSGTPCKMKTEGGRLWMRDGYEDTLPGFRASLSP